MDVSDVWAWAMAHEWSILTFAVWVLLSVAPRPHPERFTGFQRIFWLFVDRLTVLTAERAPGAWKMLLAPSPLPVALARLEPDAEPVVIDKPAQAPAGEDKETKAS
jgi:hypothetical protein